VLAHEGYTALLANTDNDEHRERAQFDALVTRRVDGFIVATARRTHPLLEEAARRNLKVVLVYRGTDRADFSVVAADDAHGVALAMEHLARTRPPADRPSGRSAGSLDRCDPRPGVPRRAALARFGRAARSRRRVRRVHRDRRVRPERAGCWTNSPT